MLDHLNALMVILVLATGVFVFAKAPACALATASKDFERRRNLWFALVLTAFLAHNFWIYILIGAALLLSAQRREQNRLAMYFFLLLALPNVSAEIPGMGVTQVLFNVGYGRLLALALLLPAYLHLRKQPGVEPFGRSLPDKLIAGYLILNMLIMLQHDPLTTVLRRGVFLAFLDAFLPYYVASRCLKNLGEFRDALMAFAVAALVLSATLVVEFAWHWLLYASLDRALGVDWGWAQYMGRGGHLRASGPIGHPIAAGYVIAVAAAFYFSLRKAVPSSTIWYLGSLLLIAGLIAPLSRGPWTGAAVMILVLVATGPAPALGFAKLGFLAFMALPVLFATGAAEAILQYLPFVGNIGAESVRFRERLAAASLQTFLENPILGKSDYLNTPAMEALRGTDGLIDAVNTYVVVGLESGLVGLSLFLGFFLAVAFGIHQGMRNLPNKNDEHHVLGRTLIATLLGILVMIGTLSPTLIIPTIYWSVAGLGVGYARMLKRGKLPEASGPAGSGPATLRRESPRAAFPPLHG